QIQSIEADLDVTFDSDLATGTLVCTAAAGSADLTQVQVATYEAILAMRYVAFDAPLPWTSKLLYDWFVDAIRGIHLTSQGTNSSCWEPGPTITVVVHSNSYLALTRRWMQADIGGGIADAVALFVHEARHAEGKLHTCGTNDATFSEMGAWAVEYDYYLW